jgi:hypothetical protein
MERKGTLEIKILDLRLAAGLNINIQVLKGDGESNDY